MKNILKKMNKPEYFFRPSQLWRRLRRHSQTSLRLPWGALFEASAAENIGKALHMLGVFDLTVSETLWRLTDKMENTIDIGANIGYMSSLLLHRIGAAGKHWAFEPHPVLFASMQANLRAHRNAELIPAALSDSRSSSVSLWIPREFSENSGLATLLEPESKERHKSIQVTTETLDHLLIPGMPIAVMKIDTEGTEARVLKGAEAKLAAHEIRDIIFEEHHPEESETIPYLAGFGYKIYRLDKKFWGPRLVPYPTKKKSSLKWEAQSYLATLDPVRAQKRMARRGWQVLKRQPQL